MHQVLIMLSVICMLDPCMSNLSLEASNFIHFPSLQNHAVLKWYAIVDFDDSPSFRIFDIMMNLKWKCKLSEMICHWFFSHISLSEESWLMSLSRSLSTSLWTIWFSDLDLVVQEFQFVGLNFIKTTNFSSCQIFLFVVLRYFYQIFSLSLYLSLDNLLKKIEVSDSEKLGLGKPIQRAFIHYAVCNGCES